MNKKVLKWELAGIIAISLTGAVLHFAFMWSGEWAPAGSIAAVNESVWEHLKLAYWPALLYSAIEYRFTRSSANNYLLGRSAAILIMPIVIITVFYTYTALLGHEILAVDITTFFFAITVGQFASYKLQTMKRLPLYLERTGMVLVAALGISFIVFTYYTPHLPLFRDWETGSYGIE